MELVKDVEYQLKSHEEQSVFDLLKSLMESCWNNNPVSRPKCKSGIVWYQIFQ